MEKTKNYIKLGLFVTIGTVLLVLALYLIGSKKNLFSETIKVNTLFRNIGGLLPGNNVRFAGINVGTIQNVKIVNDTTVLVTMIIENDSKKFIRKNSVTDIGSDGLMGNKLININASSSASTTIEENDTLLSVKSVGTDEMMHTLSNTNMNVYDISTDLKAIMKRINNNSVLWNLLSDTTLARKVRKSMENVEQTTSNASELSANMESMLKDIRDGKGAAGKLIGDKAVADDLANSIANLKAASDTAKLALHHMHEFMRDLNITPGPLGVLARDTAMANDLRSTIHNLDRSSSVLEEDLKAMQSNFLLRRYFKNKSKAVKDSVK